MRIVRVLWGEKRPLVRYDRLWDEIKCQIKQGTEVDQEVYVYGRENADRLKTMVDSHYKITLVDDSPYPLGIYDSVLPNGITTRPWRYKHELLKCAIRDYGPIIYCDWDVRCMVEDEGEAFDRMGDAPFKLSLFRYIVGVHHHPLRQGYARQMSANGSWLYLKDSRLVDQIIEEMKHTDNPRNWHDEWVLGDLIDKWHGGWPGERVWLEQYESSIMVQNGCHSPWPLASYNKDTKEVTRKTPIPFTWTMMFLARGLWRCVPEQANPCPF